MTIEPPPLPPQQPPKQAGSGRVGRAWRRFRGWPIWVQILAIFLAVGAIAAPFSSTPEKSDAKPTGPSPRRSASESPTKEPPLQSPTPSTTLSPTTEPVPTEAATVTRVIDGDTIEVTMSDGSSERVRFIGVDTPERGATFASSATSYTGTLLIVGRGVYLETDVEQRDRYGRLLAYVWLSPPGASDDEDFIRRRMVNALLLIKGWAQLLTIPPNVTYVDHFTTFQTEAREAKLGIWKPAPPPKQAPSGNCDASYPDVCIAPPPPDLDCGEISYRNFRVIGDDPHGFDGDNDGVGCES